MKTESCFRISLAAAAMFGLVGSAQAQIVVNDTLTGASSTYPWIPLGGACLTAGDGTGYIPKCAGLPYYTARGSKLIGGNSGTMPDSVGTGALRLTNGDTTTNGSNGTNEYGAIVSNFTFPTNAGVNITWTSVTYGGNAYDSGNNNAHGADGISFFLSDGAEPTPTAVGGIGGSLGYSCSNTNAVYDGVRGGYIGVGIDEYGNFDNAGDNTSTGIGFHPGRIGVRGAGSTNWAWLNANSAYSKYYPAGTNTQANIAATCKAGYAYNFSGVNQVDSTNHTIRTGNKTNDALPNYAYITSTDVSSTLTISNQEAITTPTRLNGNPITFQLIISPAGVLDLYYAIVGGTAQHVVDTLDIKAANGGTLPASFRFGFAAGTGGGSNIHEITCFKAAPQSQSNSSAGSTSQQAAQVNGGTQIFIAYYNTTNWWSSMAAYGIDQNTAAIAPIANWDGNCVLTGATTCTTTSAATTAQTSRTIMTWSPTSFQGIPFEWSNLNSTQKTALTLGDASSTDARLRFLRGDRTTELANGGAFRNRTGVLGDIIDSSPSYVGAPSSPYTAKFVDKVWGGTAPEGTSYVTFSTSTQVNRQPMVYVGANDGLLHGFRTGLFSNGVFTNNDGAELIAYMPNQVLSTIHSTTASLDYSAVAYSHNFYVDGTPGTGDLYYAGAWHTWLVGGLGPGGQPGGPISDQKTETTNSALYGLDITDPTLFTESRAASLVIGEVTPSTIVCTNDPACGTKMGQIYGTPQVRRLHDGNWAVLFGNGLNSPNGTAGLFIMHVDSTTGLKTFQYIDTGVGSSVDANPKNGIVQITPVDLDGDHITDYVYAGDLYGNLWRFDLTAKLSSAWSAGTKMFTTATGQPITTAPIVASVPAPSASGNPKVIVAFGTGQKLPISLNAAENYAPAAQALYGIWDSNMTAWNATATDTKYDSLTTGAITVTAGQLLGQTLTTVTSSKTSYRTDTSNTVCWVGSNMSTTVCPNGTTQMGWTVPLPGTDEQVIYNPTEYANDFIVNTTIPATSAQVTALTCESPVASGFTMAVQMLNGGQNSSSFFVNSATTSQSANMSGLGLSGAGTATIMLTASGKPYLVTNGLGGPPAPPPINPPTGTGSRANWTQLR